ncbi:hypothetical protein Sango_1972200 [Sesamum angolense]|uniref:SWIM-type domain-containing protein n=1 Tax=Sesamum angolense TaxID=2727404 RepID=A0AAE1WEM5_9LAMI|nr:hypothetical protein Sango_1972200 [Sesamum angolense]
MGKTGMRRGYKRVSRSHLNLITLQIQIFVSVKRILIVRTDPNRNVKGFRKDIIKDIRCHVSKHQAYRAKRKALNAIEGKAEDQFDQLWDYVAELRASNPRSTVIMAMTEGDDGTDRRKFEKLYVCFDALRQGFLHGLVSGETRESWEWFLELLKGDLNVTAGFRGLAFKKTLWNAARATTLHEFNLRMEEMGHLDPKVVDWLSDKPPEHWSRSHFNCFPKCDMLLNNICETFNSCILEAREKPILTMLEWIREFIMTRLSDNRDRARKKWSGKKICPRIQKIVEKNIDKAADCIPIKSDDWNYEISSMMSRYIVNLQQHTCTCRKWDLTGIPCKHGMSAICSQSLEPQDFVNPCYSVETFLEVYKHAILPVNGPQLWTKTGKKKDSTISKQTERGITFTAFKKDYKEHTTSSCYRTQPSNNNRGNTTFIA